MGEVVVWLVLVVSTPNGVAVESLPFGSAGECRVALSQVEEQVGSLFLPVRGVEGER